jgi:CDP-glycerol glycerophosphotransferase
MMNHSLALVVLRVVLKPFLWFFRQFIKDNQLVLFMHHHTQGFGGNPKYIANALHELDPSIKLIWFGEPLDIPSWIKVVKPHLFNLFYYHIKAKVWVDDETKPRYLSKFKDQFYIQTWHGDRGFKHIKYQYQTKPLYMLEEQYCDIFVCGSTHSVEKYPIAFKTKAHMVMQGMPGNDRFVKGLSHAQALKKKYGFEHHQCCVIAPTLTQQANEYLNESMLNLLKDELEKVTKQKWIVVYRAHYRNITSSNVQSIQFIPDVYDVLDMCDFLITDYSSIIGDYCVQSKPWVIYTPNPVLERSHHHRLSQVNYLKYIDFSEFISQLDKVLRVDFKELNDYVLKAYGTFESGYSSEFLAKEIHKKICKS